METGGFTDPALEVLIPHMSIAIVRSAQELAVYFHAAELAGGTTIEILPHDQSTVDAFIDGWDERTRPLIDIETHARTAMESGVFFVRVTEDMSYRFSPVPDVWQHIIRARRSYYKY